MKTIPPTNGSAARLTITTAHDHAFKTGDIIHITMNDNRWLMRLWRRATFRGTSQITLKMKINVSSDTTFEKLGAVPRLLLWITAHLPAREIRGEHGEPYLERYYVCSLLGWRAYIHRFLASDPDRGLHDHPWDNSISLVLAGGYRELRTYSYRILRPGHINRIRGHNFHRIMLDPGREAWTLFLHGPRTKGWGFRRNGEYTAFAEHKDDYPAARWWKTAPRGCDLRH